MSCMMFVITHTVSILKVFLLVIDYGSSIQYDSFWLNRKIISVDLETISKLIMCYFCFPYSLRNTSS